MPPWAAYQVIMDSCLVPLDKKPGVRPVGIGGIFRRVLAKAVIMACGHQATSACGTSNLSVGLKAGIEGAAHTMHRAYRQPPPPPVATSPPTDPPSETGDSPPPDPPTADDTLMLLVDAKNAFNKIGRAGLLWTARYRWPAGCRFAFNCYKHHSKLFVR